MKQKISMLLVAMLVCHLLLLELGTVSHAVQIDSGKLLTSVAYNGDTNNPVYVAVGAGGVMYRSQGADLSAANWVAIEPSSMFNPAGAPLTTFALNMNAVVYNPDDGIFVAGGQNAAIWVSADNGATWNNRSASLNAASGGRAVWGLSYHKLSNGTGLFISVHPAKTAADGEQAFVGQWNGIGFTWLPLSLAPFNSHSIAWNGDKLLIGSGSQSSRGMMHYFDFTGYVGGPVPVSPTGNTAVIFEPYGGDSVSGDLRPINGMTWFEAGSKWIAVSGNGGSGRAGIYFSTTASGEPGGADGTWTTGDFSVRQYTDYPAQFFAVASSPSAVVAVGSGGAIFHSTDGVQFSRRNVGVNADLRSVIYDGSRFVVVGANGQVLWSADGIDWSDSLEPVVPVEPYVHTGKMDGNQMLLDETFEDLDFTALTELDRHIPDKDPDNTSGNEPIVITPSAISLYDQGAADNLQATTVKLAISEDVYMQPAVSGAGSSFVNEIETVTRNEGQTSKALRIKSPDGDGHSVLRFGFHAPQQGTINLEVDVYYPNLQINDTRLPRLYAESGAPGDTRNSLAASIASGNIPYYQINNDGTGTITGGQSVAESLTDGKWRRLRFIVDTETGKVRAIVYNLDGRFAQDFGTYELNKPGNISYDVKDGLLHLGFASERFGADGILIDNLKIYREVYYKDPVKPGTISVFQIDGTYYQYVVDGPNQVIKSRSSEDMIVWKNEPDVEVHDTWALWNNTWHDFWAVEVYKFNDKYYLTYSAKKDTTLMDENFEGIDFTALPEIYRSGNNWSTILKEPQKLTLTDNGEPGGQLDATTIELELNHSVRLKPTLGTADATMNVEVVTAPKGGDAGNKALKIYNDANEAASSAFSLLFNTNYRRGETVFEADVKYLGGASLRMYTESAMPLNSRDDLDAIINDTDRPYLDFGSDGDAVMSGGVGLGNFDPDNWYRLVLRANYETGRVTATIRDETGNHALATEQYSLPVTDDLKQGAFHLGFADMQLGTEGMLIDNVKVWNTDHRPFHRLGMAVSDNVAGPYTDIGKPLFDWYAVIDSHIFQDTDGKYYLYYSRDVAGNYVMYNGVEERQSQVYGIEMESDLLSVKGEPFLLSAPTEPYERKSADTGMAWNEAPWMHKHNDTYYLFYSTNNFNSMYYNLAYSTSDSPLGPFTKYIHNPIAQTDGLYPSTQMRGLGHNSIIYSPDGKEMFITYTPNQLDGSSGSTSVPEENKGAYYNRMGFRADGSVYVNGPTLSPQPLPSGIYGYSNIASDASWTASTTKPGYSLDHLKDGEIGIYDKFADMYDWLSEDEREGAWIELAWPEARTITSVAVYDSAAPDRKISSGRLTFSNGEVFDITFPDLHGAAAIATFPPMEASGVKFEVTSMLGGGSAGLTEIKVLGKAIDDSVDPVNPPPVNPHNPAPIENAKVTPAEAEFDLNTLKHGDVELTLSLAGHTLTAIKQGDAVLAAGLDYTISGSKVVIKGAYLSGFAADSSLTLTFVFSAGLSQTVTISIVDTTAANEPEEEPPVPTVELADLDGHWASDNIRKLITLGAVEGYPDGTFKPDNNITRAEFVKLLVAAMGLQPSGGKVFGDTGSHWAKDYIATANAYGITSGYSDDRFAPDELINREQMAVMAVNAGALSLSGEDIPFLDKDAISSWAMNAIGTAQQYSIVQGYPDNSFRPAGHATRAEAATIILRLIGLQHFEL